VAAQLTAPQEGLSSVSKQVSKFLERLYSTAKVLYCTHIVLLIDIFNDDVSTAEDR
jgi:hypothetical protein